MTWKYNLIVFCIFIVGAGMLITIVQLVLLHRDNQHEAGFIMVRRTVLAVGWICLGILAAAMATLLSL